MRRSTRVSALLVIALLPCAALAACAADPGPTGPPRHVRPSLPPDGRSSLPCDDRRPSRCDGPPAQIAALLPGAVSTPAIVAPALPGPGPRPPLAPVAGIGLPTDETCARCHEEIAAEWRGSLHHRAWQNGYFVRAYALEPTPFCRKCHAPGADPSAEPPPEAREAGVGCTTCHVVTAGITGPRALAGSEQGHPVLGDARLATPAACGGCHDFAFPGPPGGGTDRMQDTLGEHGRSEAKAATCQKCHMPPLPDKDGGSHRSHAFRVQGDRAMLAQAVLVSSATLASGEVRLSMAPGSIGHAFPTGDLYRQVEVRAIPLDRAGREHNGGSTLVLGRTFAPAPSRPRAPGVHTPSVLVQRADTRLTGPRTLVLPVPPWAARARWQIVWQRLPPALATRLGMRMADHEQVVLEGTVSR